MGYIRKEKLKLEMLNSQKETDHFHQDIELLYVLEGELHVTIGDMVSHMKAEDILVVNANKRHLLTGSGDALYLKLSIEYQMVSDLFQNNYIVYWCDSTKQDNERFDDLRSHLKKLIRNYMENRGNTSNFGHIALCYRVLDTLCMYFMLNAEDKEKGDDTDRFENRIEQINSYIRANYNRAISLKDLSEKLYLSNGYLSRFFKKNYGMSFVEYLTNIRLFHAMDEILYTNIPLTRIAFDNGFPSVAVFNKSFKKVYGETPSAYRKRSKKTKEAENEPQTDALIENRLEKLMNVVDDGEEQLESEKKADVFSVANMIRFENYWGNMMSFGSSVDLLRSEIQQDIILLKSVIDFKYVRVWNPFLPEMYINPDADEENFNFSRLDSIIDFLLMQGLKPHFEMGAKPRIISYSVQRAIEKDDKNAAFMGMDKWRRVLKAMMRHMVHRYGRKETDTWRLELWYQESRWICKGADEEYYEMFDILYSTAKSYSPGVQVGGCGIRLDYQAEARRSFFRKWKQQECQPDYVSLIYFPYDRGEYDQDIYSKRSTDNDNMLHWIVREKKILEEEGYGHLPLFITEWNFTISDRNVMNDVCFKGAYLVKNIIDMYGLVQDISYFAASDKSSEYYDSNALFHGGRGLLTKQGIMKPAGYAYDFMQRMYPFFIGKGDNFLITADGHDTIGIICHNQQVLNYTYFFTREHELERDKMWKYFEGKNDLVQTIRLTDVADGEYQIKIQRINEHNGSAFALWQEMNFEKDLSRNDIKYFRRACEPRLSISRQKVENGELELNITLKPNEIAIVRVRHLAG